MESTICFKTKNGSSYIYDMNHSTILNSHPLINEILEHNHKGISMNLVSYLSDKYPNYEIEEIEFYISKYQYLKDNQYFQHINPDSIISGTVTSDVIKGCLANLDNILFQVTGGCNLSCKYCCFGEMYDNENSKKAMSRDIVDKIFEYMLPLWKSSKNLSYNNPIIIGFYGGEPLLNFPLIEYIVSCTKNLETQKLKFVFSITTNAVLLDKYMDYLVSNDFSILISLDGNKEHNKFRIFKNGEESFDIVFRNVKSLYSLYPEYFKKKVRVNSVLNANSGTKEVHDFIKNEFGIIPMLETISTNLLDFDQIEYFKKMYKPYVETAGLYKERKGDSPAFKELSLFFYYLLDNSYKHYSEMIYGISKQRRKLPTGTCLPFYNKIFITSDGLILPCERIGCDYTLGNVSDKVNIDFDRIAKIYTKLFGNISKQCRQCYSISSCSQCLFQLPTNSDKLHFCNNMHNIVAYQEHLNSLFSRLEEVPGIFNNINKMVSE